MPCAFFTAAHKEGGGKRKKEAGLMKAGFRAFTAASPRG